MTCASPHIFYPLVLSLDRAGPEISCGEPLYQSVVSVFVTVVGIDGDSAGQSAYAKAVANQRADYLKVEDALADAEQKLQAAKETKASEQGRLETTKRSCDMVQDQIRRKRDKLTNGNDDQLQQRMTAYPMAVLHELMQDAHPGAGPCLYLTETTQDQRAAKLIDETEGVLAKMHDINRDTAAIRREIKAENESLRKLKAESAQLSAVLLEQGLGDVSEDLIETLEADLDRVAKESH